MRTEKQHTLLDTLRSEAKLRNDSELAAHLDVGRDVISRLRSGKMPLTDGVRIKIQRKYRMSLRRLDSLSPPNNVEVD